MKLELLKKKEPLTIAPGEPVVVELSKMTFGYGDLPVLKDIDLVFDSPGLVSIIGPNGVGKSTLIHCMNKILEPTGGCVTVNGIDNTMIGYRDMAKVMGYVPYTTQNAFPITVTDAVLMGRHPHQGRDTTDADLRIAFETMELMGIDDLANRTLNELSAGQLQKVALAKGIAQEPRVLLLDEPTANLDIRHQVEVTRTLKRLSDERGMITVMICHDLNIAAKYSDSVIMMHGGGIFASGDPSEVITQENLEKVYGIGCRVIDDGGRPHVILGEPAGPD